MNPVVPNNGISVLLPCYRIDTWLFQAIESTLIALQDLQSQFLIVLNNLDKEDIRSIQKQVISSLTSDALIHFVDAGRTDLVGALNYGLSLCDFEFVARMDQDDVMHKDRLRIQMRYLMDNPDVGLVGTFVRRIDSEGNALGFVSYPKTSQEIYNRLKFHNCFSHSSIMFRKSVVESVGGYTGQFPQAEDYALVIDLIKRTNLANIPIVLMDYRENPLQISQQQFDEQIRSTRMIILNDEIERIRRTFAFSNYVTSSWDLPSGISDFFLSKLRFSLHLETRLVGRLLRQSSSRAHLAACRLILLSRMPKRRKFPKVLGHLIRGTLMSPSAMFNEIFFVLRKRLHVQANGYF